MKNDEGLVIRQRIFMMMYVLSVTADIIHNSIQLDT